MTKLILILTVMFSTFSISAEEIYKCTNEKGQVAFQNSPCTTKQGKAERLDITSDLVSNPRLQKLSKAKGDYESSDMFRSYNMLPDDAKSPQLEKSYREGFYAKQKVKNLPSSKGGTVDEYLNKKAKVPAVDDYGWSTTPYKGAFYIERVLQVGNLRLEYEWIVHPDGRIEASNGKSLGITK